MSKEKKKKRYVADAKYFNEPFQSGFDAEVYTKKSKQLMDGKLRNITEDDLQRFLPLDIERGKVKVAIQGGLGALCFTFTENSVLHAIQTLFSKSDYPRNLKFSQRTLYEAMGLKSYVKDGRKYYQEGPRGKQRERIHNTVLGLGMKTYLFQYFQETGRNKKGDIVGTMGLTYEQIIKTTAVYKDVRQLELKGMETAGAKDNPVKKRFSYYEVQFNAHAIGDIDRYFRYLPSGMAAEIMDYRKRKGGKASSYEFDFIEYLYTESRERIEINYMKLAEKLRIKSMYNLKKVRQTLNRCYEAARDLNYLIKFEIDRPGLKAKKDVFCLNPKRFYKLKRPQR